MNYIKSLEVGQYFRFNEHIHIITDIDHHTDRVSAVVKETYAMNNFAPSFFNGFWSPATALSKKASSEEIEELKVASDPRYSHLIPHRSYEAVDAAKNIRKTLKHHYGKDVRFSVRVTHHTTITIKPSQKIDMKELKEVTRPYKLGSWNGMTDMYDYDNKPFSEVFGGVMFIKLKEAD